MKNINSGGNNIGRFNERVILQQLTQISDNAGGLIQTWQNFRTIWGFVKEHDSFERVLSDVNRLIQTKTLIIRKQTGLTEQMRCVIAGKIFSITAIKLHNQAQQTTILQNWLELELQLMEGI